MSRELCMLGQRRVRHSASAVSLQNSQPKAPAKRSPNGPSAFFVTPHALFKFSCAETVNSVAFFCNCSADCCVGVE